MKLPRRGFLHLAAGVVVFPTASSRAWAQTYPTRPVRLIVGFSAGGPADILARLVGQRLLEQLEQPFVTENRLGAGGNIAIETVVMRAPADGYTLLLVSTANMINATFDDKLNFIRDIAPVAGIMRVSQCHDGASIISGQDASRVHHLCQIQSRQDQFRVGWHWDNEPYDR